MAEASERISTAISTAEEYRHKLLRTSLFVMLVAERKKWMRQRA